MQWSSNADSGEAESERCEQLPNRLAQQKGLHRFQSACGGPIGHSSEIEEGSEIHWSESLKRKTIQSDVPLLIAGALVRFLPSFFQRLPISNFLECARKSEESYAVAVSKIEKKTNYLIAQSTLINQPINQSANQPINQPAIE